MTRHHVSHVPSGHDGDPPDLFTALASGRAARVFPQQRCPDLLHTSQFEQSQRLLPCHPRRPASLRRASRRGRLQRHPLHPLWLQVPFARRLDPLSALWHLSFDMHSVVDYLRVTWTRTLGPLCCPNSAMTCLRRPRSLPLLRNFGLGSLFTTDGSAILSVPATRGHSQSTVSSPSPLR